MKRIKATMAGMLGLALVVALSGAPSAFADNIALQIKDGNTVCTTMQGTDFISISYHCGDWDVNLTTGLGDDYSLDLSTSNASSSGNPGTLTILLSKIDLSGTGAFGVSIGGVQNNASIQHDVYFGANSFFSFGTLISSNTYTDSVFDNSFVTGFAPTGLYSLTQSLKITPTGSNPDVSGVDAYVEAVPEPSTIALMGSGLIGLAALAWKRRSLMQGN
jgi:hypothetical protein